MNLNRGIRGTIRFALALGLILTAYGRCGDDKVTLVKKNETVAGKITKDDREGLELELKGGAKQTFKSSEIADIEWDIAEEGFHEGAAEFRKGSYDRAADSFGGIVTQADSLKRVRPVAQPYLFYMYAESLYRSGKAADAYAAYQKLIDTFKTSRYAPFALSNMADAAIQAKAFDKLPALLKQLADGGGEQKALADYYEGEALTAQGKPKEAIAKYMSAAAGAGGKTKAMALVGQAKAQAAAGDLPRAKDLAQQALSQNPPERMASRAHALIGDAILAEVESKKLGGTQLQDALLDAILEYMRVQNQYASDAATEGYALLKIGECFKRLSKLPAREQSDDAERAKSTFVKLSSDRRFAGSELANKAFKHLEEMTQK